MNKKRYFPRIGSTFFYEKAMLYKNGSQLTLTPRSEISFLISSY